MADDTTVEINLKVGGADTVARELGNISKKIGDFGEGVTNSLQKQLGIGGVAIGTALGTGLVDMIGGAIGTVKNLITGLAEDAFQLVQSAVGQASDYQQTAIQFEAILQDADKAHKLLGEIDQFSFKEGIFSSNELQQFAKDMLLGGTYAHQVTSQLERLATIATVVGKDRIPLISSALKYSQEIGVLDSRTMKTLERNGIDLSEALEKRLNVNLPTLTKMISQNKVSWDDLNKALTDVYGSGSKYNKYLDEQANSFQGVQQRLQNLGTDFLETFGGIADTGKLQKGGMLDSLSKSLESVFKIINQNKDVIAQFGVDIGKGIGELVSTYLPKFIALLPQVIAKAKELVKELKDHWPDIKKGIEDTIKSVNTLKDSLEVVVGFVKLMSSIIDFTVAGLVNAVKIAFIQLDIGLANLTGDSARVRADQKQINDLWVDQQHKLSAVVLSSATLIDKIQQTRGQTSSLALQWTDVSNRILDAGKRADFLAGKVNGIDLNKFIGPVQHPVGFIGPIRRAEGGIIPGNSYSGDKVPAQLNSGEMVLTKSDQGSLLSLIRSASRPNQTINANFNQGSRGDRQEMNMFTSILSNLH